MPKIIELPVFITGPASTDVVPVEDLTIPKTRQATLEQFFAADAQRPTVNQKAALAGTSGSPSGSNKYVTDVDVRLAPAHNTLSGLQGGAASEYYHFNAVEHAYLAAAGFGDAFVANPLSQFAATTSAQLASVISDETGSDALVFANGPTLVAPALGTPASGVATFLTGLPLSTGVTGDLALANLAPASAASRLLGRGSAAGAGDFQELTLGAGLSLAGTVLSASGLGGDVVGPAAATDAAVAVFDGATGKLLKNSSVLAAWFDQAVKMASNPTFGAMTATAVAALTTAAESWIGPSSTTGLYFKGGNSGFGTTTPGAVLDVRGDSRIYSANAAYSEGENIFYTGSAASGGGLQLHLGAAGVAPGSGTLKSYYRVRGTNANLILGIFGGAIGEQVPIEIGNATGDVLLAQAVGKVSIGMAPGGSKLGVGGLPSYANNAAAVVGGLVSGDFYLETGSDPKKVCAVI